MHEQGTGVRDAEERSVELYRQSFKLRDLNEIEADILCYRGRKENPVWVHLEPRKFIHSRILEGSSDITGKYARPVPSALYRER